jgi:hypothetical protein
MIYSFASNIISFCEKCLHTLGSLIKVIFLSRRVGKSDTNISSKEIVILGNGPSLKSLIATQKDFLEQKTLLAVNYAVLSDYYTVLQPEFYVIADPAFFFKKEHCNRFFEALTFKTTWKLKLYLSMEAKKSNLWQDKLEGCHNIEVCYFNMTPIEGFHCFTHWAYKRGWGMPRPRNVLIPSIMIALRMSFDIIYVAGADHSWLKEIWVNDDNVVMEDLNHFYDKKGSERYVSDKHLHDLLLSMHIAFKSYHAIRDYADTLGKQIYNVTEGSYIDAFVRKKLIDSNL